MESHPAYDGRRGRRHPGVHLVVVEQGMEDRHRGRADAKPETRSRSGDRVGEAAVPRLDAVSSTIELLNSPSSGTAPATSRIQTADREPARRSNLGRAGRIVAAEGHPGRSKSRARTSAPWCRRCCRGSPPERPHQITSGETPKVASSESKVAVRGEEQLQMTGAR